MLDKKIKNNSLLRTPKLCTYYQQIKSNKLFRQEAHPYFNLNRLFCFVCKVI